MVFERDAGVPVLGKNTLTRAGICGPIDPITVSKIKADTRAVLATFPVRRPGVQKEMQRVSAKIRR